MKDFVCDYIKFSDSIKQFYSKHKDFLSEMNLTIKQATMLHLFADYDGVSQKKAIEVFGNSPSTISEMISTLVDKEMIIRKVNPNNHREGIVEVTPTGRKIVEHLEILLEEYTASLTTNLSEEDRKKFNELIHKVVVDNPDKSII